MADPPEGLWLSVSELAEQRKVSPQAVSKRVRRLEDLGHLATRKGPAGAKLVNVAEFDRAVERTEDGVRASNGRPGAGPAGLAGDPNFAREQARKMAYEADLKQLDLDERLGRLLPAEAVRAAYTAVAEGMTRAVEALPARADEVMAAAAVGKPALRALLGTIAHDLRVAIGRGLDVATAGEPGEDGA